MRIVSGRWYCWKRPCIECSEQSVFVLFRFVAGDIFKSTFNAMQNKTKTRKEKEEVRKDEKNQQHHGTLNHFVSLVFFYFFIYFSLLLLLAFCRNLGL